MSYILLARKPGDIQVVEATSANSQVSELTKNQVLDWVSEYGGYCFVALILASKHFIP